MSKVKRLSAAAKAMADKKFKARSYKRHLAQVLVISILFTPFIFASLTHAYEEQAYIAKLKVNNPQVLEPLGNNVEPVFSESTHPEFASIYKFKSFYELPHLVRALKGVVEYVQEDREIRAAFVSTNDPWFTNNNQDTNSQWALPKAEFTVAWEKTRGSKDVVVAVIDTGIDSSHEDLRGTSFVTGYDFLQKKDIAPGTSTDPNSHGTLVTGVIAAVPNNFAGIAGAASGVSIMPILALNAQGVGASSVISEAIAWAADNGAHIINLSISDVGSGHDVTLANAVSYAYKKNVLLVAAAGNDSVSTGRNLDQAPVFPVCDDGGENMVLGVTASDYLDRRPDFANFGKNCIDVVAPGKRIISTVNVDPVTGSTAPNKYLYASGTSLAVPYVVAEAALIKSLYPFATNKQLRDTILATAENIEGQNYNNCGGSSCAGLLGTGRINARAAVTKELVNEQAQEGKLVQTPGGKLYYLSGGKRQPVSLFVKSQRFSGVEPLYMAEASIAYLPLGPYAEPLDGTLVQTLSSRTVYYMNKGIKLPVTWEVFQNRGFSFTNVQTLTDEEMGSWLTGSFLAPPDASILKTVKNPTVYLVFGGSLHPVNYEFYKQQGLDKLPLLVIPDQDLPSFPVGEAYVL